MLYFFLIYIKKYTQVSNLMQIIIYTWSTNLNINKYAGFVLSLMKFTMVVWSDESFYSSSFIVSSSFSLCFNACSV